MASSYDTDPELLAGIQRATTKVLGEFHRVCEELGIAYTVYGGTAIGAVRHRGFIPWDDDADICMPRPDYERFLAEAPARLGPEFRLLDPRTVPDYPQTFAVLGLAGTQFISRAAKNRPFRMPIGVDLFPLDAMPDDATVRPAEPGGGGVCSSYEAPRAPPSPSSSPSAQRPRWSCTACTGDFEHCA